MTNTQDLNIDQAPEKRFNKKWLAALAVPVAVLGGVSMASAQEAPSDTDSTDGTEAPADGEQEGHRHGRRGPRALGGFAEALGMEVADLKSALQDGQTIAELAAAQGVDLDGAIAEMVAAAEERAAENGRDDFDAAALTEKLTAAANGEVEFGQRGPRGPRAASEAVQELLGMSTDEIRDAVGDGVTLADVANDQGVSTEELVSTIVADIETRLSESDRGLPEDFDIDEVTERVTDRVNGERPERGERGGRRGPGPRGGGAPADAPVNDGTSV